MRAILAIARRELGSYFTSPLAYVITALFMLVCGFFFTQTVIPSQQASMRPVFMIIYTIMLLFTPLLTMRLIAEEQRSGTIELLLTSPVRDWEVVLGKFLAGLGFLSTMVALTGVYPILLAIYGNPDIGGIVGGYLGAVLFGAAAVAIGLFASSLTQNQIIAAVLAFTILLLLWVIDNFASIFGGPIGSALTYLALYTHFTDLTLGVIDTKDVIFYVSVVAASLFLTWQALVARRWRA